MTGYEQVLTALRAHAGLAALVGAEIYTDLAPAHAGKRFVVVKRGEVIKHRGLDNSVHAVQEPFTVECWGVDRKDSGAIADQADAALEAADLPVDGADADGIDPETLERATVLATEVWLD